MRVESFNISSFLSDAYASLIPQLYWNVSFLERATALAKRQPVFYLLSFASDEKWNDNMVMSGGPKQ